MPGIQKNISLKNYTSFKIGGRAKYFFVAKTKEDIISAIKTARKNKLPFFILAGGSKLLVSDRGYNGLVIKLQNIKSKTLNNKIRVESGLFLPLLINQLIKKNLTGLEWAAGIPGTVGGAVQGNTEAFGNSMADIVKEVEVFNAKTSKIKMYDLKDCRFGYRDSVFKKNKNLIILSALLQFKKENKKEIERKIKEYLNSRRKKQPLNFPSAGSIFKNPKGSFAGFLIEQCGLKGKRIGDAQISEKHANFIVNLGKAQAKDVEKLIELIKNKVKNKFGVNLREEIQHLGF